MILSFDGIRLTKNGGDAEVTEILQSLAERTDRGEIVGAIVIAASSGGNVESYSCLRPCDLPGVFSSLAMEKQMLLQDMIERQKSL